ncbi:hypothetical protein SS50377_22875 [Spironucleus salmonicida]|uniref:Uncharacterized protein n=1 Tax=Spironucleus salmonicida TaxID=348837 RepID=V6LVS2_9EUKA|nr:hypothetical protein SS50377_22875 [Spironucleus salmonicida]|eukprot:EST48727.1 Hypothetical protein SS50377_11044 [Spironucleus salmonicida]
MLASAICLLALLTTALNLRKISLYGQISCILGTRILQEKPLVARRLKVVPGERAALVGLSTVFFAYINARHCQKVQEALVLGCLLCDITACASALKRSGKTLMRADAVTQTGHESPLLPEGIFISRVQRIG